MDKKRKILSYYEKEHSKKIFSTLICLKDNNNCRMYLYNYKNEYNNFLDTFIYYLPYYIGNDDFISIIPTEKEKMETFLLDKSLKSRKNSKLIPKRSVSQDGIYGELLLDFYLQVICKRKPIITYAIRRNYRDNLENKGFDNQVYYIEDGEINICLCEAKFVQNSWHAKNNLLSDIGSKNEGHLNKEEIHDYLQYVVEKGFYLERKDKVIFQELINEMNEKLYSKNLVDILVEKSVCFNFIFFAVFKSVYKNPELLIDYYNELIASAIENINEAGIIKYKIEIIFIPTDAVPIEIKERIEEFYE